MNQHYMQKFLTPDQAVERAVQSGDWIDYGFGAGFPELLDQALARQKGRLKDVKIRVTQNRRASTTIAGTSATMSANSSPAGWWSFFP